MGDEMKMESKDEMRDRESDERDYAVDEITVDAVVGGVVVPMVVR